MTDAPADAAMFEVPLKGFMAEHKLRFKWARQDILRMEAADGGPQAPICLTFPASFWAEWDVTDPHMRTVAAESLTGMVKLQYRPTEHPHFAQEVVADLGFLI